MFYYQLYFTGIIHISKQLLYILLEEIVRSRMLVPLLSGLCVLRFGEVVCSVNRLSIEFPLAYLSLYRDSVTRDFTVSV